MRRSIKHVLADRSGQTIVEFSLSVLMLVLVMLGVFEMSRMMLLYTTVSNAARAGDRYAIVHGVDAQASVNQIQTLVKNYLRAAPMAAANATVTVSASADDATWTTNTPPGAKGSFVRVAVVYTYDPFITYFTRFFSINISSTSQGVVTW